MRLWAQQALQDLRFGARSLGRNRGFTVIALLSLALGIAATTAIYSVVHAVILDPFAYRDVDTLMSVKVWEPGERGFRTYYTTDQFLEIAARTRIFDGVVASTISDVLWTGDVEPQRLRGNHVTDRTFEVMGVPPLHGRALTPADFAADAEPVVVLGYRFWQGQFGGETSVMGRRMVLNDTVRTVVGVMPRRFMWRGADVYVPIVLQPGKVVEGVRMVHLLARLKPGVSEAQAEADLGPIIADLRRRDPGQFPERFRVGLLSFKETFPSAIREAVWILFGAVSLLLLIACTNVSSLLLSRAALRQREMAVRASLGAGRGRLARQLLTESLLLAVAGGALGVALAFVALRAIIALVPPDTIPDESVIAINVPVLLFTLAATVLAALVFGLAPALHASRPNLSEPLKQAARSVAASGHPLLRNGLVVAEVALSLMLLVGASLMVRTLVAMAGVDLGVEPGRVLTLRVPFSDRRHPDMARRGTFMRDLLERVQGLPGVAAAAVNTGFHPMGNWRTAVEITGQGRPDTRRVLVHQVSPDYTRVFGIALRRGRIFTASEAAAGRRLAMVNDAFVRRYITEGDPLGRSVRIPALKERPYLLADDSFELAGVVADVVNRAPAREAEPEVYFPFTVTGAADRLVVLADAPAALAGAIRAQVQALDRDQPVANVRTLESALDEWVYARPRFNMVLFSVFAGLGLTLAMIGVYGVISHAVAQQRHEIGVRIALGAGFGDIAGMVLRRGLLLLGTGIVLGLLGSLATTRLLAQQVWSVSPFDPVSFAAVSAILLAAGLQACFWPARRAARVDPVSALRCE